MKKAVVVGSTNGIGKAISCRLAADGFSVIAVGRQKEGRAEEIVKNLTECSSQSQEAAKIQHEFRPCDAFSLVQVKECASGIVRDHSKIDALVVSRSKY